MDCIKFSTTFVFWLMCNILVGTLFSRCNLTMGPWSSDSKGTHDADVYFFTKILKWPVTTKMFYACKYHKEVCDPASFETLSVA